LRRIHVSLLPAKAA